MVFGDGQDIRFFEKNATRKFRGFAVEDCQRRIQFLFGEKLNELIANAIGHLDRHMGVRAPERAQQLGNVATRKRLQDADSQAPWGIERLEFSFHRSACMQDGEAYFEQPFPGGSRDDRGAPSVEQFDVELGFEFGDARRDRRLRDRRASSAFRETARLDDGDEVPDLMEFHV
jgi:hypothetical protein